MTRDSQEELLAELEQLPAITPVDPDDASYVAERRRLLGPVADISHPDFGRENRPEENFALETTVVHPNGDHCIVHVVSKILDNAGVEVSQEEYWAKL